MSKILGQAFRALLRRRGFFVLTVFTLALAIGANTAIFSVVHGVLLRPLPYEQSDRLVQVFTQFPEEGLTQFPVSPAEFTDYRAETRLFEELGAWATGSGVLSGIEGPERVEVAGTSAGLWPTLRVRAALGRVYGPDEDRPGHSDFVVVSHGLWQRRFGGDPAIIGRTITLDDVGYVVLGVMPRDFAFPGPEVELWGGLGLDPTAGGRSGHFLNVVGRLKPDATLEQVRTELDVVTDRWQRQYEHAHPMTAVGLREQVVGDVQTPLLVLLATVALVLLIACANVAGLMLARGTARGHELAVRTALGADRRQLLTSFMAEAVIIAAAGGVLGLVLAWGAIELLRRIGPESLPRIDAVALDGPVLLFTLGVSLLTTLAFGLLPAWRMSRPDPSAALREARSDSAGSSSRSRARHLLVVAEIAAALVLLVGASLLLRTLWNLQQVDPGFRSDGVLTARVSLPTPRYPEPVDKEQFFAELAQRVESLPGVRGVSHVDRLPLWEELIVERFRIVGGPVVDNDDAPSTAIQVVAPEFFSTLGVPLLEGRDFTPSDRPGAPRAVIVNETLARAFFRDQGAIGEQVEILAARPVDEPFRIVGVVGDVRDSGLVVPPQPTMYLPHRQATEYLSGISSNATLVVRTSVTPATLVNPIRSQLQAIDPELVLFDAQTMETVLAQNLAQPKQTAMLLALFAIIALVLATVGVYGLLVQIVGQRTREFGVRFALGADRWNVLRMVLRRGLGLTVLGLALGAMVALGLTRLLGSLLFGVEPLDVVSFLVTVVLLTAAALFACYLPARRAAGVDPILALRAD
ncbi:MAG TPA: ABC transporter permease [Thermoanaerobaculia bacterium]|nr:ABC transporter permease [Thermoanaerobaculia bacterium]